jgi:O-antigen ligase
MNGWYSVKPHWPLIDLRYVLTVVIYLAIRNIDDIYKWLIRGVMIGAVFNTFNAVYHYVMYLDSIPKGAYSLLFFGPVSGLMSLLILYSDAEEYKSIFLKGLRYCGILGGFVALMLSTARGGLLASLIMLALYPFLSGKLSIKKSLAYLILLLLVLAGFFTVSKLIRDNVLVGTVQELKSHYHNLTLPKNEFYKVRLNGITARFELWRATIRIVKENPVYGVSRAKLRQHFKEMIVNGKIHPQLEKYDQPHNVYLYYLVTRGVVGTSLFLLVLLIPFFIFKKKRKGASVNAISGTVFVSYFGILSLTQSNVFARGHYLSFFLIVLTVLMGSNILSRANSRGG